MPPPSASTPESDARKRRSHKKSRNGCGNCKLRRVKCDETKPRCEKCLSYGVTCSYGPTSTSAALSVEVAFKVDLTTPARAPARRAVAPCPHRSLPPPLPHTGSIDSPDAVYQLTPADVRLLERFQKRTIKSLGSPTSRDIYERKTLPIAFSHPFVMHTVLALSHLHDTALLPCPPKPSPAFTYHWYRAVSLLHRKLSLPILPAERDALWVAAALVGVASFANLPDDARHPRDAWPLRAPSPSDLDWMKLGDGKKQVWVLANPCRAEGVFRDVANEVYAQIAAFKKDQASVKDGEEEEEEEEEEGDHLERSLPAGFCELFGLRETPPDENPYWVAAEALAGCWDAPVDPGAREQVLPFMVFISRLDPRFRRLLEERDERAMLLLAYWYSKVCDRRHWWMWRRAVLETRAICEFLTERWKERWEVRLIEFPRMMAERCVL